jgi:hypothetical protein
MTLTPFEGVCIDTGKMMNITWLHDLSFMICATPCSYSDQVFDTRNIQVRQKHLTVFEI